MAEQALATSLRLIRVFLSSPGEVASERAIVRELVRDLSSDPLLRNRVVLQTVAWDDLGSRTPMLATLPPQEAINRRLPRPSQCQIVVVILWSRMGTPLPFPQYQKDDGTPYVSGTEWEYLDAIKNRAKQSDKLPLVVVYRRTERIHLDIEDLKSRKNGSNMN